jgi:hydroxypyruvate reductase
LEAIASGPTVPDPTTKAGAIGILKKYDIEKQIPDSVRQALESGSKLPVGEEQASRLQNVQNSIVGDNRFAAQAALEQAEHEGVHAEILTNALQGEARDVGRDVAQRLRDESSTRARPFCLIAGGETTVTIRGEGKGGRNQEVALAAVDELSGLQDIMFISLGTDGDDGPTDAAGAVVTGETAQRAKSLGLDPADHLARNDAYPFFEALGDLLKTGPTGTNVNDLIFLIAI